jgi:hypothetical protein
LVFEIGSGFGLYYYNVGFSKSAKQKNARDLIGRAHGERHCAANINLLILWWFGHAEKTPDQYRSSTYAFRIVDSGTPKRIMANRLLGHDVVTVNSL